MHFRFIMFKMIVTSGFLAASEHTKFVFGRGIPAGEAYGVLPSPLAGLRWTLLLRREEGEER